MQPLAVLVVIFAITLQTQSNCHLQNVEVERAGIKRRMWYVGQMGKWGMRLMRT